LVDGVDEVPSVLGDEGNEWYPREMLLNGLAAAVARWGTTRGRKRKEMANRFLVTSRPYGINEDQRQRLSLRHVPIDALATPLQQLLVRRWFCHLNDDRAVALETAEEMIEHIHEERALDELTSNPLLLTAMCIVYDEGKRLPQDKYELYDRIVDTVLHKRYPQVKQKVGMIRNRLGAVALGMHSGEGLNQQRSNPEAVASEDEIDVILQSYREEDRANEQGWLSTAEVREDLLSQTGLLVSRDDRRAQFYHLSFQEFLAAERWVVLNAQHQEQLVKWLLHFGVSPPWRNTLSFMFGCYVTKFRAKVGIDLLCSAANELCSTDGPVLQTWKHEEAWNLARILADCLEILAGRGANVHFFHELADKAIHPEVRLPVRYALALTSGWLGDPRIETDLRNPAAYVEIPSGFYPVGDKDKRQEVHIAKPFLLSRYPVTNAQYALFIEDNGYGRQELWSAEGWLWLRQKNVTRPSHWHDTNWNVPNQPLVGVSYYEAEAFCRWAGGRLPTEREWEAAARGPEGFEYPWGDNWQDGICNSHEADLGVTSSVGIFPQSRSQRFGLDDMAGNVWEWCQDLYDPDRFASSRVLRGGSWDNDAGGCRSADREWNGPASRLDDLGFRVAVGAPGGEDENKSSEEAEPGA